MKVKIRPQEPRDDSDPFVGGPVDGTPLLSINESGKESKVKQYLKGIETPLFILLILYFIAIYAEFTYVASSCFGLLTIAPSYSLI